MSVTVCVRGEGRVCMAADSQATNNGCKTALARSTGKIVKRAGMLFAAGALPMLDALRWHIADPEPESMPLERWAATVFAPWMAAWLRDRDLLQKQSDGEVLMPASCFIARGPDFVMVDPNQGVICFADPFRAAGSGSPEAHGALWAMTPAERDSGYPDVIAEQLARQAVAAAIALDTGCSPPIVVEWTDPL